tara:strand:- start:1304 stop:2491 length:1188 start_codon:yes stop_codon:yes gene_type:complete
MKFLNKKEQVLDTLLTPYGEYLLSTGRFKPEYYAFYDDNVLYEKQYDLGVAEGQNSIEPRIQEDTPQLETQVVFTDRNRYKAKSISSFGLIDSPDIGYGGVASYGIGSSTAAGGGTSTGVAGGYNPDQPPQNPGIEQTPENIEDVSKSYSLFEKDYYGPQYALGTTDKFTNKAPAWSVSMIRGDITSATSASSGPARPTLDIPQLEAKLTYEIDVIADVAFVSDTELAVSYENGEILDIKPEVLIAQIKEANAEFSSDNFDIQVFEVTTDSITGGHGSVGPHEVEILRPLTFRRRPSLVKNDILLDEEEITISQKPPTPDNVEYYFTIKVDKQIDDRIICSSIADNKASGRYINIDFECEDTTNIALVDIYSTNARSKPCPDLEDPCEDNPGTVY